jgi:serine/threonine-protein kinase
MAPEQALGQPVDGRSDLFSLGSVAYQLLTGVRPFEADNVPRILARVAYETPQPVSAVARDVPADVDYLLQRALAKPAQDRYPDGQSFAEDITDVLEGRSPRHREAWQPRQSGTGTLADAERPVAQPPIPADSGGLAPPPRRTGKKRLPAGLLAAAIAIGGVGIAALVLTSLRRDQTGEPPGSSPAAARARPSSETLPTPRPPAPSAEPTPLPSATATPRPTAEPTPAPTSRSARVALLAIDLEHPFERGVLKLWLDKKLILEREFEGEVQKNLLIAKIRKGRLESALAIPPGFHDIWVEVRWDDNAKRKSKGISATFKAGATRTLTIRVGRFRKNLSLEWE